MHCQRTLEPRRIDPNEPVFGGKHHITWPLLNIAINVFAHVGYSRSYLPIGGEPVTQPGCKRLFALFLSGSATPFLLIFDVGLVSALERGMGTGTENRTVAMSSTGCENNYCG